jgi:hypothetical protein
VEEMSNSAYLSAFLSNYRLRIHSLARKENGIKRLKKFNFALEQAMKAQRGSRVIAILFL